MSSLLRAITGTVKPSRTPATVAWTPDSCISTQAITASGTSSQNDRIRLCTATQKSPIGTSVPSSAQMLRSLV